MSSVQLTVISLVSAPPSLAPLIRAWVTEVTEPDVYSIHMPGLEEKFAAKFMIDSTFKELTFRVE